MAAVNHRREPIVVPTVDDKPDQDPVVAGFDRFFQSAHGISRRIGFEHRTASTNRTAPRDRVELVGNLGRHPPRQLLAPNSEDVRREATSVLDSGQCVGGLVDACKGERRLQRDGAERTDGEAAREAVLTKCGEDYDPAWKAAHDLPKSLWLDHERTIQGRVDEHSFVRWERLRLIRWETRSTCLRPPRETGFGALSRTPRRSRSVAGGRSRPAATSSWRRLQAAARRWPHSSGASIA